MIVYILFYWLFVLFVVLNEFLRKKKSKVDFFTLFSFSFLMSYLLPSALWVTFPETFFEGVAYQLYYNPAQSIEVIASLLIGYFIFFVSYSLFSRSKLPFLVSIVPLKSCRSIVRSITFIIIMSCFLVVIGIVLMNGVGNFISAGIEARHNHSGFGVVGYFRYFYSIFPILFIAAMLFLVERRQLKLSRSFVFLMFFVLILGWVALISNGGRGGLVSVVINIVFFLYMIGKIKVNIKQILVGFLVLYLMLFVVLELHSISSAVLRGDAINLVGRFNTFFDKIGKAFLSVFQYSAHYLYIITEWFVEPSLYNYPRLGSDNITAFVLLAPGFDAVSVGLYDIPDNISQEVMGKTNGAIPPGWIGWALLNGGFVWLFFKVIYSAFFAALLDKSKSNIIESFGAPIGSFFYFSLLLFLSILLFSATSTNMLRSAIGFILYVFFMFFMPYMRVGKLKLKLMR